MRLRKALGGRVGSDAASVRGVSCRGVAVTRFVKPPARARGARRDVWGGASARLWKNSHSKLLGPQGGPLGWVLVDAATELVGQEAQRRVWPPSAGQDERLGSRRGRQEGPAGGR